LEAPPDEWVTLRGVISFNALSVTAASALPSVDVNVEVNPASCTIVLFRPCLNIWVFNNLDLNPNFLSPL
jgi:hypothetical protein